MQRQSAVNVFLSHDWPATGDRGRLHTDCHVERNYVRRDRSSMEKAGGPRTGTGTVGRKNESVQGKRRE